MLVVTINDINVCSRNSRQYKEETKYKQVIEYSNRVDTSSGNKEDELYYN